MKSNLKILLTRLTNGFEGGLSTRSFDLLKVVTEIYGKTGPTNATGKDDKDQIDLERVSRGPILGLIIGLILSLIVFMFEFIKVF